MACKFNIPTNTKLLKISSFNVNLSDSVNRMANIDIIIKYVFSEINNLILDIICIQGINDINVSKIFIRKILAVSNKNGCPVEVYPKFDVRTSKSVDISYEKEWNSSETNKKVCSNIIISKYPIINYNDGNNDNNNNDKNNNDNNISCVNIDIDGYIVSIYNIVLSEDVLHLSNHEKRNSEINILIKNIKKNSDYLKKYNLKLQNKYIIKDTHIICGNFNIIEMKNNFFNSELTHVLKSLNAIDVYRYNSMINKKEDSGFNNSYDIRDCYITILSFDSSNPEQKSIKEMVTDIYKNHGIAIILAYVVTSIKVNEYFPIEIILLLNKQEKKRISS